jgi:hypothetical protein
MEEIREKLTYLIPLSEYVKWISFSTVPFEKRYELIERYAALMLSKVKLGMFDKNSYECLFKGWFIEDNLIVNKGNAVDLYSRAFKTLEELHNFLEDNTLFELTDTALIKLGLKHE